VRLRRHDQSPRPPFCPFAVSSRIDFLRRLRDCSAVCDSCGRVGTIARATRHANPPSVSRYCSACWPEERRRRLASFDEIRKAILLGDPAGLPAASVAESLESCSWLDVQDYLSQALSDGPVDTEIAKTWARKYLEWAPFMDGPIPEQVQRFIDTYGSADAP
jgi:hypothetical protein